MGEDLLEHECSVKGKIYLNSFWGGEHERCVQVTIGLEYVQMTFKEAKRLFKKAIKTIEKKEKEYDKNPPWWEQLWLKSKTNKQHSEESL